MKRLLDGLEKAPIVAILPVVTPTLLLRAVDSLLNAGLTVVEVTLRSPDAMDAIELIAAERPDIMVGAGTVLTREDLDSVRDLGAHFVISPALDTDLLEYAMQSGTPMIPGVATASELLAAMQAGTNLVKWFPADALGGVRTIKQVGAPFVHTGVRLIPTGGITAEGALEYLRLDIVAAVGGSMVTPRQWIEEERFDAIEDQARTILSGALNG